MEQEKVSKIIKKHAPNPHVLTVSGHYALNLTAKLGMVGRKCDAMVKF